MAEQLDAARSRHLMRQTHQLAEQVRGLWGSEAYMTSAELQSAAVDCDAFWDKRHILLNLPGPIQTQELSEDLQDIAIYAARVRASLAHDAPEEAALRILDEAEATFGPSPVLGLERQILRPSGATPVLPRPASTPWEHY